MGTLSSVLFLVILFYFSLASKLLPERYDIQEGTRSEVDIAAPMQIPNTKATLKAQEEAAERVQPIYQIVQLRNENLMTTLLDRIDRLNQDDQISSQDKIDIYRDEIPQRQKDFVSNFINNNRKAGTYSETLWKRSET